MTANILPPKTYQNHPNQWKLRYFLHKLLVHPEPNHITSELVTFLKQHPLPLDDFPRLEGTYTRTVLIREENGFEAMAARWSKGATSTIHGHPFFNFYYVVQGCMKIDDYEISDEGLVLTQRGSIQSEEEFSYTGLQGTFDNNIHQVHAIEETLSIHLSSDDSAKGQVFG